MSSPREAQLPLLLSISEGLSRGTDEMLRVSPQGDAIHPPSCSLAIRESVEEIKWLRAEVERLLAALEYMVNVCPAIDPDGDRAHEQARKALEGKP